MKKLFWIVALLYAWFGRDGARGQQKAPVSSLQEDCGVIFNFTAASTGAQAAGTVTAGSTGTTSVINNEQASCLDWTIQYSTDTTVTGISLLFQTAVDVLGVPGTWSNYPGTLTTGINPNTAVTAGGAVTEASGPKYPFLRLNLTSYTGTGAVKGKLIGWKRRPPSSVNVIGICPGTAATPCIVAGPDGVASNPTKNPVLVAGQDNGSGSGNLFVLQTNAAGALLGASESTGIADGDADSTNFPRTMQPGGTLAFPRYPVRNYWFNGVSWDKNFYCTNQAHVTLSDATMTQLVALTASQVIRVCHIHMSTTATETITISYGTGSACGTGTTTIDKYLVTQYLAMDFQPTAALRTIASNALCITQSAVQAAEITVIYAKF